MQFPDTSFVNVGERLRALTEEARRLQRIAVESANASSDCGDYVTYVDGAPRVYDDRIPSAANASALLLGTTPLNRRGAGAPDSLLFVLEDFAAGEYSSELRRQEPYHPTPFGHEALAGLLLEEDDPTFGAGSPFTQDLDIMFVVNTGSTMGDRLDFLSASIETVVDRFESDARTARFGLVTYGQNGVTARTTGITGEPTFAGDGFSFNGSDDFIFEVQELLPDSAGPVVQSGLAGVVSAVDDFDWRDGVKKVVILITDTPSQSVEPAIGATPESVRQQLYDLDPAELYAVVDFGGTFLVEADLSSGSNGQLFESSANDLGLAIEGIAQLVQEAPFAWAGERTFGFAGEELVLDSFGSFDPNGTIQSYEWDLDGDQVFETNAGSARTQTATFDEPGETVVGLRVTDNDGLTHIGTVRVTIEDPPQLDEQPPELADQNVTIESLDSAVAIDVLPADLSEINLRSLDVLDFGLTYGDISVELSDLGRPVLSYQPRQATIDQFFEFLQLNPDLAEQANDDLNLAEIDGLPAISETIPFFACSVDGPCGGANLIVEFSTSLFRLPPETSEDTASVSIGETTEIDVLSNDNDPDGEIDADSLRILQFGSLGSATVEQGVVIYSADSSAGTDSLIYEVCDFDFKCSEGTISVTVLAGNTGSLPACSALVVDSFQAAPWSFTFQVRNSTSSPLDFELVIPDANYQLTNLVFNGSSQNVSLDQTQNTDGTYDIVVSGRLPAYQSVGGQQPNGFGGQIAPTNTAPETNCGTPNIGDDSDGTTGSLPACSALVVDSFQAAPWSFTFQVRNSTSSPLDFELVIPDANYQLTNLVFNGSSQNVSLDQTQNTDGTYDIVVSGRLPAYQSVGGQQPNGFEGALTPTNGTPETNCQGA